MLKSPKESGFGQLGLGPILFSFSFFSSYFLYSLHTQGFALGTQGQQF
jgi:hypothetical protein